jgi:hypothetical protein
MVETVVRPRGFVQFTFISISPGNPQRKYYTRVDTITDFAEVPAEYARLGAGTYLIDRRGEVMYSVEDIEEIASRIAVADRELKE